MTSKLSRYAPNPGDRVVWRGLHCQVARVHPSGGRIDLTDEDGEYYENIDPRAVHVERLPPHAVRKDIPEPLRKKIPKAVTRVVKNLPPMDDLTDLQRRYVMEYCVDGNRVAAYYRAGGDASDYQHARICAHSIHYHPKVAVALKACQEELRKECVVELWEIVMTTKKILDMALAAVPVHDDKGKKTGRFQAELSTALKAVEFLARLFGHGTKQQVEVTGPGGGPIEHRHAHAVFQFTPEMIDRLKPETLRDVLEVYREIHPEQGALPAPAENKEGTMDGEVEEIIRVSREAQLDGNGEAAAPG